MTYTVSGGALKSTQTKPNVGDCVNCISDVNRTHLSHYHKLLEQLSPIERDQVAYTFDQSLTAVLFVNGQPLIGKYNGHKSFAYFTIQIR